MRKPVGMRRRRPGSTTTGCGTQARRSSPALPGVAGSGRGRSEFSLVRRIRTAISSAMFLFGSELDLHLLQPEACGLPEHGQGAGRGVENLARQLEDMLGLDAVDPGEDLVHGELAAIVVL